LGNQRGGEERGGKHYGIVRWSCHWLGGWLLRLLARAFLRSSLFLSLRSSLFLSLRSSFAPIFRISCMIDDSVSLAFKLLWIPSLVVVQSAECSWVFLFHSILWSILIGFSLWILVCFTALREILCCFAVLHATVTASTAAATYVVCLCVMFFF
jgi:hypothetical protein